MSADCETLMRWLLQEGTLVYLTGEAGTGKTYLVRQLLQRWPTPSHADHPTVAVVAPTGLAAEHIGGQTIHSYLHIPVKPYELHYQCDGLLSLNPNDFATYEGKDQSAYIAQIKALKLLIIDEISMVRCDLMEIVEARLRMLRESPKPFGGLSLLLVGDLHQLPPVCDPNQRDYLLINTDHRSLYFFDAHCLHHPDVKLKFMELKEVKRVQQGKKKSAELRQMLHEIREGQWTPETQNIVEQRYDLVREHFEPRAGHKYLCTHRIRAAIINQWMLRYLPGQFVRIATRFAGDGEAYMNERPALLLKIGAPVMFTDTDNEATQKERRRFCKGTFGLVTQICEEHLMIAIRQADGSYKQERITRMRWNKDKQPQLERIPRSQYNQVRNYISQYPIELAWAITIHKSQGSSLDSVFVDAQELFDPGQLYVALSRATSMAGLHLLAPLTKPQIQVNPSVAKFEAAMRKQSRHDHKPPKP